MSDDIDNVAEREAVRRRVLSRVSRYTRLKESDAPESLLLSELELIGKALIEVQPADLVNICERYPSFKAADHRRRAEDDDQPPPTPGDYPEDVDESDEPARW